MPEAEIWFMSLLGQVTNICEISARSAIFSALWWHRKKSKLVIFPVFCQCINYLLSQQPEIQYVSSLRQFIIICKILAMSANFSALWWHRRQSKLVIFRVNCQFINNLSLQQPEIQYVSSLRLLTNICKILAISANFSSLQWHRKQSKLAIFQVY